MIQSSLFKNIPKLDENIRNKNKEILSKTRSQSTASKPITVRSANLMQQKIELIKRKAGERLKHDEGKYQLIRTKDELVEYVDRVIESGYAGIDTETTGLDPISDHLVGTALYSPGSKACYIPHKHINSMGTLLDNQISYEDMAEQIQRMEDAKVKFILHNAKFDLRVIMNWLKVRFTPYWCTNIASNFLNENEPHGLKALHDKYILRGEEDKELNTFTSLFEDESFNYIPIEIGYLYAAKDAEMTFELFKFQEPYLTPDNQACISQNLQDAAKLFRETEMPLVPILADMEEEGVYINDKLAKEMSVEYTEKMKESALKAVEIIESFDLSKLPDSKLSKLNGPITISDDVELPAKINIGSPTQLAIIMYDLLELKSPDKKKPRGTGEEILEMIADKVEDKAIKKLFKHILDFRVYKKLLSTYIDKMPLEVKEKTGKLHGTFNQYGAKTGRFSSSSPNLQNIPSRGEAGKRIRQMFHAGEGYVLISSDFSQQEPRVLAHLAYTLFGDSSMMDAYNQGLDLYSWLASEIYNQPYEACMEFHPETGAKQDEGKEMRDSVKSVILGQQTGRLVAQAIRLLPCEP